ncbi:MAG: CocE/NonD family hydrolase [Gammaproteobacteria bacterium]
MNSFKPLGLAWALCLLCSSAWADPPQFRWGVKIPMRDSITLNATLYLPPQAVAPAPCIFTLTPYAADNFHARGVYFATHGYPFAVVEVRGRGNSQGEFRPFIQEAKDGYDAVEWLARQPWCNGKVALYGSSYGGYDQWVTAKEFPPHLRTIVPTASPYPGIDYPMRNNISYPFLIQWITLTNGHTSQARIAADDALWSGLYRRWFESGLPFNQLDRMFGNPSALFQEWLSHPQPDGYWDAYNPTADQYRRLQIPILTITGSYDDDQTGALEHYRRYMSQASPDAKARHYLVIGPWDHGGTATPQADVGGVSFGPASLLNLAQLHLDWYAWTMQGAPKPGFLEKPVAYYVAVSDVWRYASTLEAVTARSDAYYLDSTRNAIDIFSSGSLGNSKGKGRPDSYRYDPRDPAAPEIEAEARATEGSLVDQTMVLALGGRELVYQTAPFAKDTEVSGFFKLQAWIGIDCPDTDLYAAVYDIDESGGSVRLTTDAIRARYREGLRTPQLITTRAPLRYDFERFTFVSRLIQRRHRLRLVISPMGRMIESRFTQKNYNGGGVVAEESARDGRPVTVALYHDRAHPSVLNVPLAREKP